MATCPECNTPLLVPKAHNGYCSLECRVQGAVADSMPTPKRKRAKRVQIAPPTELQEHLVLARWLDAAGVLWAHVPNGEYRNWSVARRLKSMGVKPGVPDILIFTVPPLLVLARGVAIELKRQGARTCSSEQAAWMAELKAAGWVVALCPGASSAIDWLSALGFRIKTGLPT